MPTLSKKNRQDNSKTRRPAKPTNPASTNKPEAAPAASPASAKNKPEAAPAALKMEDLAYVNLFGNLVTFEEANKICSRALDVLAGARYAMFHLRDLDGVDVEYYINFCQLLYGGLGFIESGLNRIFPQGNGELFPAAAAKAEADSPPYFEVDFLGRDY